MIVLNITTNVIGKGTNRQLATIRLALDNGYYEQPRKTSIAELARQTSVAHSTFEEHLRKPRTSSSSMWASSYDSFLVHKQNTAWASVLTKCPVWPGRTEWWGFGSTLD